MKGIGFIGQLKKTGFIVICLGLTIIGSIAPFLSQAAETKKWIPPKFVKEWEIKEIKPGLRHEIISITANKNGVFVSVKAEERNYIPPKKWEDLSEIEKQKEIRMMNSMFGRILSENERLMDKGHLFSRTEGINHYRIQQYDHSGTFIKQWPDGNKLILSSELKEKSKAINVSIYDQIKREFHNVDSREILLAPFKIVTCETDKLLIIDYLGNKIVKFDSEGKVLSCWKIEPNESRSIYFDEHTKPRGLFATQDKVFTISKGYDEKTGNTTKITEYKIDGSLIRNKIIPPLKVPDRDPFIGLEIPFVKSEGFVTDMAVDKDKNLYLFVPDTNLFVFDRNWNRKGHIKTYLKKGFDRFKPVHDYDQDMARTYNNERSKMRGGYFMGFNSKRYAWIVRGPGLYYANKIHISPDEEIYVSFIGEKPFGTIDAMIFTKQGKLKGILKHANKSYSDWFDKLSELEKSKSTDLNLDIAFFEKNIFIGRTIHDDKGAGEVHSLIQKFIR